MLHDFVRRPTPLYLAGAITRSLGGATLYFKREDLSEAGGNLINAALGQCLLAQRMGFRHVIADTGSGHNGVALAATAAKLALRCTVFMAEADARQHGSLVARMRALDAGVSIVDGAGNALHEAVSAAMRYWMANSESVFYVAGAPVGPHPYPMLIREFQSVIGREVRAQLAGNEGRLPTALVAATGGGSAAIGLFSAFAGEPSIRLIAVEAGGTSSQPGFHAAKLTLGRPGILHGAKTSVLQDADGQILPTHSVAAGLKYPGIAPELAWMHRSGRLESWVVRDHQAIDARRVVEEHEGLRPSLESCHALSAGMQLARLSPSEAIVIVPVMGG